MSTAAVVANVHANAEKIGSIIQDESGYWVNLHIVGHPRWKKLQARHRRKAKREAENLVKNYKLVVAHTNDTFAKTGMIVQIVIPVTANCPRHCQEHILKVMKEQWGQYLEESSEIFKWCKLTGLKTSKDSAEGTIILSGKIALRQENTLVSLEAVSLTINHHLNRSGKHFPYVDGKCVVKFSAARLITWKNRSKEVYSQNLEDYKQWEAQQTDLIW